jgi:hypothetical protein
MLSAAGHVLQLLLSGLPGVVVWVSRFCNLLADRRCPVVVMQAVLGECR